MGVSEMLCIEGAFLRLPHASAVEARLGFAMARTVRDTNLETRAARSRLALRRNPYWRSLESGLHLGYRRTKIGGGTWVVRRFLGDGKYAECGLGLATIFRTRTA
jgi:hypothetical protein